MGPPLPGDGERPYRVTFVSRLSEGPVVATFDGGAGATRGYPPGWRCTDPDEPAPERQWRRHVASLGPCGGLEAAADTPLDAWNRLERRALADVLPPFAELPVARRRRIAEMSVPRLEGRPASRRAALAGAAVYLSLLVGVPAAVATGLAAYDPVVSAAVARETPVTTGPPPGAGGRDARRARDGRDPARPAPPGQSSAARISEASLVGR